LTIIARNVRCGRGEIDLVALDEDVLVFVEVKARTDRSWREGLEKIDWRKRRALTAACRRYLRTTRRPVTEYRVDAVSVDYEAGRFGLRVRRIEWEREVFPL